MAQTEGRVARPERRWGCRRGTPALNVNISQMVGDTAKVTINH